MHIRHTRRVVLSASLRAAATASGALLAACGGEATAPTGTPLAIGAAPAPVGGTAASTPAAPNAPPVRTPTTAAAAAAPTAPATPMATAATAATAAMANVAGRIPSPALGVPDAYTTLPPPRRSVNAVPTKGGKITVLDFSNVPPVTAKPQNAYWQELEKRLGTTIEPTFIPNNTYTEKFAAIAAAGEFADINYLIGPSPEQLRLIQQGAFTDLTPYLTGDALKEFPNLALYPQQLWKNSTIRGKLYGVPRPLFLATNTVLLIRRDWAEKVGAPNPKNADEFLSVITAFTKGDPDGNGRADTFGLGNISGVGGDTYALGWLQYMFRVPNGWRKNPDGTLVASLETEEFKAAVAFARRLQEAGAFHPDAATMTTAQAQDFIASSKLGAHPGGLPTLPGAGQMWERLQKSTPSERNIVERLQYLIPPGFDGGKPAIHNTNGYHGIAAIPAKVGRDRERVRELLRVLDYYCAPFGSEEWVFMNYGVKDIHHSVTADGSPVRTDKGNADIGDFWHLATGERVFILSRAAGGREVHAGHHPRSPRQRHRQPDMGFVLAYERDEGCRTLATAH